MPFFHFARLDWRLWFVPLGMGRGRWDLPDWVQGFILQLLRGSEPVARLTRHPEIVTEKPPIGVRVSVWDYHFSSCDPSVHQCPAQVSVTGAEWEAAYIRPENCWGVPRVKATRSIVLDRSSGESLGFEAQRTATSIVVRTVVPGGLLSRWNANHAGENVMEGDTLVQVNGSVDADGMLEELEREAVLSCEVRQAPRQQPTEWGRWWYRRLVCRHGEYSLGQGQSLQFRTESGRQQF